MFVYGTGGVIKIVAVAWFAMTWLSNGLIQHEPDALAGAEVAIVPGSRIFSSGEPSLMVQGRTSGAVDLYQAGKVGHVLVSGDNRESNYNEPAVMRNVVVDLGVPAKDVSPDYAGFDTWDTCRRAVEQFGVTDGIVITQRLHAKRTAALCRSAGMTVQVLTVEPPRQRTVTKVRVRIRESLASVKALGDIVRKPPAHHGGPFVGLTGSVNMPAGGHPPDWNWDTNTANVAGSP